MEVADGIHRFGTRMVNWYLIERGGRITLVDAGMRGYWPQLTDALTALGGKVEEVEAVVLTHAHADHVGFAHQVKANSDATVWVHERDAEPGLRRFPPFRLYLRPTAWPLLVHGLRNGLLATPDAAEVRTFTDGDVLDVPGRPRVRHLPGHTRGNCALHLPDASVVFSGDTLVTFDPYRQRRGPHRTQRAAPDGRRRCGTWPRSYCRAPSRTLTRSAYSRRPSRPRWDRSRGG